MNICETNFLLSRCNSYTICILLSIVQGTHCTGKTGKMPPKYPCHGKHREFRNFAKTQEILYAQLVNSLILKVKNIAIIAKMILMVFFNKLDTSAKSVLCNVIITNHVN